MKKLNYRLLPFIVGVAIVCMIGYFSFKISCPSNSQYLILRILLSIAAGCIGVLITGFLNVSISPKIKGRGAFGLILLTYFFTPGSLDHTDKCYLSFTYTITLIDMSGNRPVKDFGFINLISEDYPSNPIKVDNMGSASFLKIPAKLKDSNIMVHSEITGWWFQNGKRDTIIRLTNSDASLIVIRDGSLCCIVGSVRDSATAEYLQNVKVRIGDISVLTDENGRFKITMPVELQEEEYRLISEKVGYQKREDRVYPQPKQEALIMLDKK